MAPINEDDLSGVAPGSTEEQLMQRGAAAKDSLLGNGVVTEHGDERSGEHEILLNLFV